MVGLDRTVGGMTTLRRIAKGKQTHVKNLNVNFISVGHVTLLLGYAVVKSLGAHRPPQ